ncbi:MAG: hypothetical protein FWG98_06235 [Candidatus Cloacimonetes bacterium]|nr:hypothetical protein [Candidatus Cloacimonadota bacterium]
MKTDKDEIITNGIKINTVKIDNIIKWLIQQEAENVRTKARNDVQMIADIQKRIEEEIKCY